MKKLVKSDLFDITNRVKLIDKDYLIYFDTIAENYLLYAQDLYCLNLGNVLDARVLNKIYATRVENSDSIFDEIEKHNATIDATAKSNRSDESTYKFNEIYGYANAHSKDIDYNSIFKTKWI